MFYTHLFQAKGVVRWTCSQFEEHNGDSVFYQPIDHWVRGCEACRAEVVEGPYRLVTLDYDAYLSSEIGVDWV